MPSGTSHNLSRVGFESLERVKLAIPLSSSVAVCLAPQAQWEYGRQKLNIIIRICMGIRPARDLSYLKNVSNRVGSGK